MMFGIVDQRPGYPGLANLEVAATLSMQPMLDDTIHVAAGSPLDLTALRDTATPAGALGRIRVHASDSAKFAESSAPTTAVRFNVAAWAPDRTEVPLPSSLTEITAGVEHLARCGYNALRVHGLEYWLMDGTTGAFNFPADRLRLFDWLLAECKRVGVFWIINPRAPELYQDGQGGGRFSMPGSALNMKPRLFTQQDAMDHWRTGFERLYGRVNQFTGIGILQDPALFLIECMNECSAQFNASKGFPSVWMARDVGSTQGSAAMIWPEWLATQYANIGALNTQYSTAYASFAAVPAPSAVNISDITATQDSIDAVRYCDYLNRHIAAYFRAQLSAMGYTGLVSTLIDFASTLTLKSGGDSNVDVVNLHGYPMLAHFPSDNLLSAASTPVWGSGTSPGYTSWLVTAGAFADGKPAYIGEFGWPSWAAYRNQYPLLAAYMALNGAGSVSCFHQGDFFSSAYNATAKDRVKALYSYSAAADPVVNFSEVAAFFALECVSESAYTQTIPVTDRYSGINLDGTSPRTAGRVSRATANLFLPTQIIPSVVRTRLQYGADNTDDALNATWNAKSWFTTLDDLKTAGAFDATNEGWISANANHGSITAVAVSGSVVGAYATVTASATQPVLTIGTHTLVDDDHIAITNLTGSGGTWPGTNNRGTRAYVKRVDTNKVQIMAGLNLTGLTGFTAGTWSEFDNVNQSANKQVYMSRRFKAAHIDTAKFKFFCQSSATLPWTKIAGLTVNSLTADAAVFVAALDGQPIATSSRLLLGMVGNADNTGQTFSDATRAVCTNFGAYPIKMDDCTADLSITVTTPQEWKLYRLRRDGGRATRETPTEIDADASALRLSLRSGSVQPAIFWELAR